MTSNGHTQTRSGADRPITRADLQAKFDQLKEATETPAETARGAGIAIAIVAGVAVVVVVYLLGRRRGRRRRTVIEVRRV